MVPDEAVYASFAHLYAAQTFRSPFGNRSIAMPQPPAEDDRAHVPVMLPQVLDALSPSAGEVMIDATYGGGGYSRALLEAGVRVIGIDRDPDVIDAAKDQVDRWDGRLSVEHGRFSTLDAIAQSLGYELVDGVVADIGISSMQIDQAKRGFSFQQDGPLDMRMEQAGPTAADVVNNSERSGLTRIIGILGEERQASRISAEIVKQRESTPFETTLQLARCIEKVLGRKHSDRIHPATRTFQALRIYVNRELEELAAALLAAERILKPGGRLVIVSFHSLEDRLVKKFLIDRSQQRGGSRHLPAVAEKEATFILPRKSKIAASVEEADINPRARSAKLRLGLRTAAAARDADYSIFGLPNLDPVRKGAKR